MRFNATIPRKTWPLLFYIPAHSLRELEVVSECGELWDLGHELHSRIGEPSVSEPLADEGEERPAVY
jgi:hypothetical protein